MRPRTIDEIEAHEWVVSVVMAIAGIVNGGVLIILGEASLQELGTFWGLFFASGLLGAVIFPIAAIRLSNEVADSVIAVTSQSDGLASFFGDIVSEFGLASVTAPIGIGIGIGLWLVFGVFLIPIVMTATGQGALFSVPHVSFGMFIGYFFYGFSMGGFFGLVVPALERRKVTQEPLAAG